jgi:hypothetical protein
MMRLMRGCRDHCFPSRAWNRFENGVHLGLGAIFVVHTLHGEYRTLHAAQRFAQIPGIERRSEPSAGPIPEQAFRVLAMIFAQLGAHSRYVSIDGGTNTGTRNRFDEYMGGFGDDASWWLMRLERAIEQRNRAAVAMPDQDTILYVVMAEQLPQDFGFAMHVSRGAHLRGSGRAAMSTPVIDEGRHVRGRGELCREIAPLAHAADPMMQENEDGFVPGAIDPFDI